MKAMVLNKIESLENNKKPLNQVDVSEPTPGVKEILVKILACGVCHTELDEIEGRTPPHKLPIILGHQVIGTVEETGSDLARLKPGDRVGVAWIFRACGECKFCLEGNENLCDQFMATGRDANGGYAEYMTVSEDYAIKIPDVFSDTQAAPLLCAGAVGYRALRLTGIEDGKKLGLTGFGASGHIVLKVARHMYPNTKIYVFARNQKERLFAKELGAVWSGDTEENSPEKLDYIIDTTPAWKPIVEALENLEKGGRLVINAIRKEDFDKDYLLKLDYSVHLWQEKEIKSVANVTRRDVGEFLELAAEIPLIPEVQEFRLEEANDALVELKDGKIRGAKVLKIS